MHLIRCAFFYLPGQNKEQWSTSLNVVLSISRLSKKIQFNFTVVSFILEFSTHHHIRHHY
jgi:hypothetical protein